MTSENSIRALLSRARTKEAREGIKLADQVSDMILFHTRIYNNGRKMEQPWDEERR